MSPSTRPQCSVYIATSLDGYIAREDGDIEWLNQISATVPPGNDLGYGDFMASIDALVMGRKSFEKVVSFGMWPSEGTPVIVLSRRGVAIPPELAGKVSTTSESLEALVKRLGGEGMKRLYIDGGRTVQSFMDAGLIDDITLTLIPILLGSGISLFGPLESDIHLRATSSRSLPAGLVQVCYEVKR